MRVVPPNDDGLALAVEALRAGGIIAYPTETVYGLGVDPQNPGALDLLFREKARDPDKAVLVIVDGPKQLERVVAHIAPLARRFMDRFWPGPLSLLLPAAPGLPAQIAGPQQKICVRQPACDIARAICRAFGSPITSTSANPAGGRPARRVSDIGLPGIAVAVDGGELPESPPSTIFDPGTRQVLRQGVIPADELKALE